MDAFGGGWFEASSSSGPNVAMTFNLPVMRSAVSVCNVSHVISCALPTLACQKCCSMPWMSGLVKPRCSGRCSVEGPERADFDFAPYCHKCDAGSPGHSTE